MDDNLILIFSFVLIITMISLAFGSSMHKRQLAYKERKEAIERERADRLPGATNDSIAQLEDRVRVLERIATDRGQLLSEEIEALRASIPQEREKEGTD